MIKIQNLTKQYHKSEFKALDNISFSIENGMYGLLGNNGAGKSTLMNILTTLLPLTSGNVYVDGIMLKPKNFEKIRENIGYMPQENAMYPDMTVENAIEYFSILNKVGHEKRKALSNDLLLYINMIDEKKKKYKTLSGGMKRRLALAIALINNPPIIIADEPTTGVDPSERIRMRELLLSLSKEKTILLSTHIIEDISYMCSNLAVLNSGHLIYNGSVKELIKNAQGKVWQYAATNENEINYLRKKYGIIGMSVTENKTLIKFYTAEKPEFLSISIDPTLEEAYIVLAKEHECV